MNEKDKIEGELVGTRVIIWNIEEFEEFVEKGYGKLTPLKNPNRVELDLIEACFLLEYNKINIKKDKKEMKFKEFYNYSSKKIENFPQLYSVYRDLRNRGYTVKTGLKFGAHFRVYEKGVRIKRGPKEPHEHTKWIVWVFPEEKKLEINELTRAVRLAHAIRANLILAIVDRENEIVYYRVTRELL